jgi:hypothetical protein
MKRVIPAVACFTIAISLLGCGTAPSTQSSNLQTSADAQVQDDVMRMIGTYEAAAGGSNKPRLLSVTAIGKRGNAISERWVVESNRKSITYQVLLVPSPKGGTDYSIARISQ